VSLTAVVMAAGEGRRLRPLTERWPKPVLPIDGRPVVASLVRELAAAGFREATIVVGHLGDQVEALLGDGRGFGVELRFVRQPEPLGSADAVGHALAAGARPPLLVTAADTVFRRGDIAAAGAAFEGAAAAGGLGVRPLPAADAGHRTAVVVRDGRVLEIAGRRAVEAGELVLTAAPLWFLGAEIASSLAGLDGPPYELSVAFRRAIGAGRTVVALPLGPTRDLTSPADVVERNFPYLWSRGAREGRG